MTPPVPTPFDVMVPVSTPPIQMMVGTVTVEGLWGTGYVTPLARWRVATVPIPATASWRPLAAPPAPHWKAPDSRWGGT